MALVFEKLRTSITIKALFIGLLVLLLLIPVNMVKSVITEREYVYRSAASEVTGSWGKEVLLIDPVLTVEQHHKSSFSNGGYRYFNNYQHMRPEQSLIKAALQTQIRKRGIFRIPVYTAKITMQGTFILPPEKQGSMDLIKEGTIQIPINVKSIKQPPELSWDGKKIPLEVVENQKSGNCVVFSSRLKNLTSTPDQRHTYTLVFELVGSNALQFIARAKQNTIHLSSNWNSPGFFGSNLPLSHQITDNGFSADWAVNNLFENPGHENEETISSAWFANHEKFGVRFVQSVDTYQLITRAIKYAIFIISLIFAAYLLYEMMGNVLLHLVQYLFIGFANCVFYLLLLSLAEHISFNSAYLISALSTTLLISLYSISLLQQRSRGLLIGTILSAVYTFLYITLQSEDYALLIGSIGLFVILALIMYLTRNINWYTEPVAKPDP